MIQLIVNGEAMSLPAQTTVDQLLDMLELPHRRVAVEINRDIIPKSEHREHQLQADDQVEIVHAMGGG